MDGGRALVIVTSVAALIQRTVAYETFTLACDILKVGQRVQTDALLQSWIDIGYTPEAAVEVPGTLSRRGGILDVYPPNQAWPARIELLGDSIESIRLFDPATQRSQELVDALQIIPAREMLPLLADGPGADALGTGGVRGRRTGRSMTATWAASPGSWRRWPPGPWWRAAPSMPGSSTRAPCWTS